MDKHALMQRFDAVLARGKATIESAPPSTSRIMEPHVWVDESLASGFTTAGLSLLQSMFSKNHYHFKNFYASTFDRRTISDFKRAYAIIDALRDEVSNDWLFNTRALIAAEVFGDILEMAEYLLLEGYKDAAAVLIGSSLESHLRRLCPKAGVDTHYDDNGKQRPRKAETLNQELHKKDAYKLGDQKQITAWLDLRNNAAHGDRDKYTQREVELMLGWVQDFVTRVPA